MYTLFLAREASHNNELVDTLRLIGRKIGVRRARVTGTSNINTGSTTLAFSHKHLRDEAREWALRFAQERNIDHTGII